MTKTAAHRTTDLSRNTDGAAVRFGDIDGFNPLSVGEFKQPFAGFVGRELFRRHFGTAQHKTVIQFLTQGLRQVGHLVKIGLTVKIDPLPDLLKPEGRFAQRFQMLAQLIAGQADQFNFFTHLRHLALMAL